MLVLDRYQVKDQWWKLLFVFLPILASCATLKMEPGVVARTVIFEPTADLRNAMAEDFELLGRVAVRNEQQRFSGNVHWQHTRLEDTILLLSPLGQAVAEIKKNDNGVSLVTSKQEAFHARDVEELTLEILGWRLPLDGLQYWIQGLYSPLSTAAVDLDSDDRVISIRQDGWEILFTRYTAAYTDQPGEPGETQMRPRIIELKFEDLGIRMVIDNWTGA
ncbi:MAG: outer membrane lipoprotein LolB [Burkholderiales bacterium]|nr:outer membrane lipoprotein LolB [Nitrosomonas sp.]MCP5275147.1 outer membrane lipoprotein LolB [Burkholderiales bacterium]